MRVVAGRWRGHPLTAPRGVDTRPTADRVREAMFSALTSRMGTLEGAVALDLYAGSGALGIEALSRGAVRATFVECDRRALGALRGNLSRLSIGPEVARVLDRRVERSAGLLAGEGASLLLADPPYRIDADEFRQVLEALAGCGAISLGATVVYEHSGRSTPVWPDRFAAGESKRYGDTMVSYARYEG